MMKSLTALLSLKVAEAAVLARAEIAIERHRAPNAPLLMADAACCQGLRIIAVNHGRHDAAMICGVLDAVALDKGRYG